VNPLCVAMLIPDNRDEFQNYDRPEPEFGPAPAALLEGLANLPDCAVHLLTTTRRPMPAPARLADNLYYHSLPIGAWGRMRGFYSGSVLAIRRKLQTLKPQLVHGQGAERYCALAAAFSGYQNLITIHGNMRAVARAQQAKPFSYFWLSAFLEGVAARRAGGVLCLSAYAQHQVRGLAKRTWVLPNAVAGAFFEITRAPAPETMLLCIANIARHKNQHRLIAALASLARQRQFRLRFAGRIESGDPYSEEFHRLIRQNAWCEYLGYCSRQELRKELAQAALLVLPTLEDNCPMVVLEAMAAGVPVAAARVGGVPELVRPGITGELFDPLDLADIRAKIEQMLNQPDHLQTMGQAARQIAREQHNPRHIAEAHLQIYRELLG
jgi:glycosyltransferase involved in cell wall biosynthesis